MYHEKLKWNPLLPLVWLQMATADKSAGGGAAAAGSGGPAAAAAAAAKHVGTSGQRVVLPSLTAVLLLVAMPLLIWTIDTSTIRGHVRTSSFLRPQEYLIRTITATATATAGPASSLPVVSSPPPPLQQPSNLTDTDTDSDSDTAAAAATSIQIPAPAPQAQNPAAPATPAAATVGPRWISLDLEANLTSTLLSRWLAPGGEPCRDSRTTNISIPGLDGRSSPIELPAGQIHEFVISALDDAGSPRCLGGDYFETDISGATWKSRPPVTDHGNGSYTFFLQVHPDFAGDYNFTVVLLFRSFEGLKFSPERFAFRKELRKIPIRFYRKGGGDPAASLPQLRRCRASDFTSREVWSGRWTQHGGNDQCPIGHDGRYRCLPPRFHCPKPWCGGPLGSLESNGWVYSAHCSFRIFTQDAAWRCLRGRWLFFWGDSNHVDTIRNLLNFVLGLPEVKAVPRRFDTNFTNPRRPSESVRITSIFNGHWNETKNYQGLYSLRNQGFRELVEKYFSGEEGGGRVPDAMVLNSGLHDGVYWRNIRAFSEGAEYAAGFWEDVLRRVRERGAVPPELFYRTTIATGGYARDLAFNPNKMEAFNGVFLDKLKARGLLTGGVIDEFDMTFPWHWDNRCNDGVHYGRAPARARWRDGGIGHQYFVDLMLAHVLLNAICHGGRGV